MCFSSFSEHIYSCIFKLPGDLASHKSYHHNCFHPRTYCRNKRSPPPLSNYSKWKLQQQADWGASTLNRENIPQNSNPKQCSNANCRKTIYKSFPSHKMLLSNNYLHKQKKSKHVTSFVKGVILLTEKLMFSNWWLLSNTICHLLSWASV